MQAVKETDCVTLGGPTTQVICDNNNTLNLNPTDVIHLYPKQLISYTHK